MVIELKIAMHETGPLNSASVKIGELKEGRQNTTNSGLVVERDVEDVGFS